MSVLQEEIKRDIPDAASTLEGSLPSTSATSNPGECPKNQTDDHPQEAKDADMSVLLNEIKRFSPEAASTLEEADLHSDSEILSLTREDLRDLFPEAKNFQLRRRVYEIILRQKPIGVLKEMQQLIQHESLCAALTNNGVLDECLPILKDLKTQVQSLLESHLSLPESISNNQQDPEPNKGSLPSTSAPSNPGECPKNQTDDHPPEANCIPRTGGRPQKSQNADMSVLLNEIKRFSPEAASTLEEAGLHSDSEILSLTREDLRDLIPGAKNFQLRRRVYEIIHRQKPIGVLKEMQQLIQHESLREAGLHSDSEILSLTQEDLHDLFPGAENFQLRRRVYEIILRQKPIGVLKEMQQLIQHESLRAALTNNGVLDECPHILKDLKTQVNNVQSLLESRLSLPESISNNQQDLEPNKGCNAGSLPSTSATSNPGECPKNQTDDHPQEPKGSPRTGGRPQKSQSKVTYEVVVCGKTFDAHLQLMNIVKSPVQDWLQFIESSEDSQVVVVFCPISSRIGSDVEAAMREVKVEKPVILVLMHHRRDAGSTNYGRTWDNPNVVLCVSVFYHETINGLVKCDENKVAVAQIQMKLMEYKTEVKIPMQVDGSSSRSWW